MSKQSSSDEAQSEINLKQFEWVYSKQTGEDDAARVDLVAGGVIFHLHVDTDEEGCTVVKFTHDPETYPHNIASRDVTAEEMMEAAAGVVKFMDEHLPKSEDVSPTYPREEM